LTVPRLLPPGPKMGAFNSSSLIWSDPSHCCAQSRCALQNRPYSTFACQQVSGWGTCNISKATSVRRLNSSEDRRTRYWMIHPCASQFMHVKQRYSTCTVVCSDACGRPVDGAVAGVTAFTFGCVSRASECRPVVAQVQNRAPAAPSSVCRFECLSNQRPR